MVHRKPLSSQRSPRSSTRPNHFPYIINPSLMRHPPPLIYCWIRINDVVPRCYRTGWSKGISVGIGTRNVIAFRCRERYFGEISGLNRRSISIATSTSRSAHGICMSERIPLRRDATWTAHTISIRPENRRNSWNRYAIPSLLPFPSPLPTLAAFCMSGT